MRPTTVVAKKYGNSLLWKFAKRIQIEPNVKLLKVEQDFASLSPQVDLDKTKHIQMNISVFGT